MPRPCKYFRPRVALPVYCSPKTFQVSVVAMSSIKYWAPSPLRNLTHDSFHVLSNVWNAARICVITGIRSHLPIIGVIVPDDGSSFTIYAVLIRQQQLLRAIEWTGKATAYRIDRLSCTLVLACFRYPSLPHWLYSRIS